MKIELKKLRYVYPSGDEALKGINLEIEGTDPVAVIGQNGAGKTTVVKHFNGILRPSSGEVLINDESIEKRSTAQWSKEVGYVFQNPDDQLFMANIYDDIAFGPRNMGLDEESVRYRVEDRLKLLGISNLRDKTALKMSGGEKRMAAMATVLAMKPSVMLLDEPTAFLDPKARRTLINVLNTLPHTMLIATHDLAFAKEVCEHVVVMKEGRVFAEGSCVDILYDEKLMDEGGLESIR